MKNLVCVLLFALLSGIAVSSFAALPGDSVYRTPVVLADQNGREFPLAKRAGKPQLVSMFYTSCPYVCPLIIDTLKRTQAALSPGQRAKVDVLLVSFDPERDTPQRLHDVFDERHLDAATWTLARTDAPSVRKLAAVLDIQYRALANREINHSSALVLLDGEGRIVARTDKIDGTDPEFIAKLQHALE